MTRDRFDSSDDSPDLSATSLPARRGIVESASECTADEVVRYYKPAEWAIFWLVIVLGVLLRWVDLAARPMHHDESLHGMYGRYFFDFPDYNFYKYDPMLHGPFLYNLYRTIYSTFGSTNWSARFPMALLGTLFMFVPLMYRRYLSKISVQALTMAVAFSPTLIYWSRFAREDVLVLTGMLFMLYGATLSPPRFRSLWVLFGVTWQFCIKENVFVTVAILVGYLVFESFAMSFLRKQRFSPDSITIVPAPRETVTSGERSLLGKLVANINEHFLPLIFALGLCAAWEIYFYSAGFRYTEGILHPFYKSIEYWTHQHAIDRIKGPFLFHFYTLAWYEFPFVVVLFVHLWMFYREALKPVKIVAICSALVGIGLWQYFVWKEYSVEENPFFKAIKLENTLDILGFFFIVPHAVLVTVDSLIKGKNRLAFWGYLFMASFATYSYLGEKVPWLTVYPFVAGLIYFAFFFEDYFARHPFETWREVSLGRTIGIIGGILLVLGLAFAAQDGVAWNRVDQGANSFFASQDFLDDLGFIISGAVLALLSYLEPWNRFLGTYNFKHAAFVIVGIFLVRAAVLTNFLYAGKETEFISQVHTTDEFQEVALRIRYESLHEPKGFSPQIFVDGEATWPVTWYFRDLTGYKFSVTPQQRADMDFMKTYDYIIQDWAETMTNVPPGFQVRKLNLRGWWVPDYREMTLKKFLDYSLNHRNWNQSGFSYVTLLTRPR